jgi:hypothetical protein
MENLSLNWYKKQLKKLKILEKEFKKSIEKVEGSKKPYSKLKMVNDVLTVVLLDGEIIMKVPATVEDFNNVKNASVEKDIIAVFSEKNNLQEVNEHVIKQNRMLNISKGIQVLETSGDFDVKNGSVYLKGVNRSLPELLIEKFVEIVLQYPESSEDFKTDEKYISLKRFFMWCCLNPRAEVADSLYEFLVKNSFRITKQGFFVALRNVVSLEVDNGSNLKVQFISNAYNKVKGVWKKNPHDYRVAELEDGILTIEKVRSLPKGTALGNLKSLYMDLPNMTENRFTDDWTKTFDIRIGKVVSMPMEECNWSTQDCAASGLHFTANEINYVGCGDQSVLMLINPMKVVGIGEKKGRCYEYLPIMTVSRDEATSILHDLDFDTIDLDEHYIEHELNDLEEKAKTNFAIEANKHEFNIPSICTIDMKNIVENLKQIKDELGKRVQEII